MLKLLKYFAWLVLVLVILAGIDQLLVRVPLKAPGLTQAQTFYGDFRDRLLGMIGFERQQNGQSIEQLIESKAALPEQAPQKSLRYLYVDETGALQFADGLEQVPVKYRKEAQPLAE